MTVSATPLKRWVRAALLAAATVPAALGGRTAPAQPAPSPAAATPTPPAAFANPAQNVQATLAADAASLRGGSPAEREEAARRLMGRQNPAADEIVRQVAAEKTNRQALAAIARAAASDPTPDPALIPLLAELLGGPSTSDAAAALASYREPAGALQRVLDYIVNPRSPEATRIAAVRGLGASTDQQAAQGLVALVANPAQPPAVRDAAAGALADMTRLRENGTDAAAWVRWWDQNKPKRPEQFRADLLDRFKRLRPPDPDLIKDLYQLTPEAQRADFIARCLASPSPATRIAGVNLVTDYEFLRFGRLPPDPVRARLRDMIRDSAPEVRLEVAKMLRTMNDKPALEALLTQLNQEPDADVRAAFVRAMVPMGDVRAVPELQRLFADPSPGVAVEAARALRDLAPAVRAAPAVEAQVRADLLARFKGGAGRPPAAEPLRSAYLEALAPLADRVPDAGPWLLQLLRSNESPDTRRAALRGLEALREQGTADGIIQAIRDDRDAGVRLAAVNALGQVAGLGRAGGTFSTLFTDPREDQPVREAAWLVFQKLLPNANEQELNYWAYAKDITDDPARQVDVLTALVRKQQRKGNDWASNQENLGNAYLRVKRPEDADEAFKQALNWWQDHGGADLVIRKITRLRLNALLASRHYADAVEFANAQMVRFPAFADDPVMSTFANGAEQLAEAGDRDNAQALAREVLAKIKPPAAVPLDRFRARLEAIRNLPPASPPTPPRR